MSQPRRFLLVSLIPLILWLGFVILNEKGMWPSAGFRIAYGIVFIASFYGISIFLIFRKNVSKWLIALLLLPPTAVITYLVLIFLKPRNSSNTVSEPLRKCGGCGSESSADLQITHDKKNNDGYLCKSCQTEYARLLSPESIRNFWMCGACGFRILAGTNIDARVDERSECPKCGTDVNVSLVNLNNNRAIGRGIIGEPIE